MADQIRLTRRICRDLRAALRVSTGPPSPGAVVQYAARCKVEDLLRYEKSSDTTRGGRILARAMFSNDADLAFQILRDLMLVVLVDCTQMQVRRALKKHITTLDEWSGTSAVESLGRLAEMRVA